VTELLKINGEKTWRSLATARDDTMALGPRGKEVAIRKLLFRFNIINRIATSFPLPKNYFNCHSEAKRGISSSILSTNNFPIIFAGIISFVLTCTSCQNNDTSGGIQDSSAKSDSDKGDAMHLLPKNPKPRETSAIVWKTQRGWDSSMEELYSAWVYALFNGYDEQDSWPALHAVTQNQKQNFLYNYLSLGEDDPDNKHTVIMQPDCADNPFFLRAYFAWKLGLPFGYHVCDRGYVGKNPGTGQWITNESSSSKTNPVDAFNTFLRKLKDGVHSGTARISLDNENSDYYPVPLEPEALRPGTVYADPYGHTLILISRKPQTSRQPGLLLAVDAQPDGTIAIKRFWKGNFLFNTSGVIGEPGFKAFRPVTLNNGVPRMMKNNELTIAAGFVPFSLQQRKMESALFYQSMERIINPDPLDPEEALSDLMGALHEQLLVRVTSVANGEAYFKAHPGTVIPMPSNAAGIFLAGGQWENFSTPNRDLRLLIAMDEVLNFPGRENLKSLFDRKTKELFINYTKSDGTVKKLTLDEILKRRDAFEMAYNPNDGPEIRWGAPENSDERASCKRHAPANQLATMRSVRSWFSKRLHPPT